MCRSERDLVCYINAVTAPVRVQRMTADWAGKISHCLVSCICLSCEAELQRGVQKHYGFNVKQRF